MKVMSLKHFILIFVSVLLCSCIRERSMKYDAALLEPEVQNVDLMIAYQVPAGYKMVSQSFTDSVARAELAANPFTEKRVTIFVDTLIGNSTICLYDMRALPYERTEDRLDFYFSTYNANGQWESIEKNTFRHGDFKQITELDMVNTSTDRRLLKYYFYEDGKAQFSIDYYFRNSYYNDLKPYIESSLASVHKSHEIIIELLDQ